MNHIHGTDRRQIKMISLEQMVEKKSMVRIIDAFIDMLYILIEKLPVVLIEKYPVLSYKNTINI